MRQGGAMMQMSCLCEIKGQGLMTTGIGGGASASFLASGTGAGFSASLQTDMHQSYELDDA